MKISLRPHHFLCLQGFKGQSYNNVQVGYWGIISKLLKDNPQADVFIKKGKDELCANCSSEIFRNKFKCIEKNVSILDEKIINILGLKSGATYKFGEIEDLLHKKMTPEKHKKLCSLCTWWQKGLCHDSFK